MVICGIFLFLPAIARSRLLSGRTCFVRVFMPFFHQAFVTSRMGFWKQAVRAITHTQERRVLM
ncbi:hypothetical protein CT154_01885 [Komagataeibacter xylinus]|nr:hypothetical protein CT154_01885 [Komagataeibacter xylinus]